MLGDSEQRDTFTAEVSGLAEEVTELCILAIEVFKTAASALFAAEPQVAAAALQDAHGCTSSARTIHQRAIAILARWAPTGEDLRRLVGLQRAASEYARIAEHSQHAAEHALALRGAAEQELRTLDTQAPDALVALIRRVYIALRGCLLLTATRDRPLARRLVAEDAELERLYRLLQQTIERAVALQPQRALTLHRLLFVLTEFRQVGSRVVAICDDQLYTPPHIAGR